MPQQDKIYYVTKEQYDILYNNGEKDGSFKYNGVTYTYDENATYYVPADGYGQFKEVFSYRKEVPEEDLGAVEIEHLYIQNAYGSGVSDNSAFFDFTLKNNYIYVLEIIGEDSEQNANYGDYFAKCVDGRLTACGFIMNSGTRTEVYITVGSSGISLSLEYGFNAVEVKIYETQLHF